MAGTAGAKGLRLEELGMYESLDGYMAGLEEQRGEWASEGPLRREESLFLPSGGPLTSRETDLVPGP